MAMCAGPSVGCPEKVVKYCFLVTSSESFVARRFLAKEGPISLAVVSSRVFASSSSNVAL